MDVQVTSAPPRSTNAASLLREISDYCRRTGMAESTFGRLAVNDGKFANRLRCGGQVTLNTLERIQLFMTRHAEPSPAGGATRRARARPTGAGPASPFLASAMPAIGGSREPDPLQNFRFFDNRQKYLTFVNTCGEKWTVASRVSLELANIHPRPPAVRVFDAGVGDGTVLTRVMRSMHRRYGMMPFYVVGKEISVEDVRLTLEKMPDRFTEHPATVLVMTNMNYAEPPWLAPASVSAATSLVWHELVLQGTSSAEFEDQITALQPFLSENWRAHVSAKSGNPVYDKPIVLVIYREDCRFLLDPVRPKPGMVHADFDLVIASQPYRARASVAFKSRRVIAPLTRGLAPGGRLIGIHSCGDDPGLEIVRAVWPDEDPFRTNRQDILRATKTELGAKARHYNFKSAADERSRFRYYMHTLPNEIEGASSSIGTSTLLAAWNAAIYVAQIEDERLTQAMGNNDYLEATRDVLRKRGALWFWDESFVISRKRDLG